MFIDNWFFIGLGFFLSIIIIQQVYFGYKIRRISQQTGQKQSKSAETRLTPNETLLFGLSQILFYAYIILGCLYYVWIEKFSVILGIVFIAVSIYLIRKPIKLIRDNHLISAESSVALPNLPKVKTRITPEVITEILADERVIGIIKKELAKTCQIGYKEQWRLGLLTPDIDMFDLSYNLLSPQERFRKFPDPVTMINLNNQIPIKRTAIINPTTYFTILANRIMIYHGTMKPMIQQYPGWIYKLIGEMPGDGYWNIRDLVIDTDSPSTTNRSRSLPKFLCEDGFPLKEHYLDGDPLTTERGGTIIVDKEVVKVIYLNYYVQSRIIDDEGNLIYLGLDENFGSSSTWKGISVIPSVSKKLYQYVTFNKYVPIVRFRSFPYSSNFMLPLLDTPMSDSGWADLFVDPRGKAKLFIAKDKSLNEWFEMMDKLRQLFLEELAKEGYHLLGLTKDPTHLYEYFSKKQNILEDYFLVQDWSLI